MGGEEESKRMLPLEQMKITLKPGTGKASYALGSRPARLHFANDDHETEEVRVQPSVLALVMSSIWAVILWMWCLPVLGCAAWILSRGTTPKTSGINLPWAAYCVAWSAIHALLSNPITFVICLRTMKPSFPPLPFYYAALVASALSGFVAVGGGLAVLVLTHDHYDERDETRTVTCRSSKYRISRKCHPRTLEGKVYTVSIVCFCFAAIAL
ncbi:hypothetical protein P885DRAFT_76630 [Corynascus similis CBS 632.67]